MSSMNLDLPIETVFILAALSEAGFQSFLVGGAVRDLIVISLQQTQQPLAGQPKAVYDFDFTTDATPAQIQKIFPESFYENEFGMVSVVHENLLKQMSEKGLKLPKENLQTEFARSLASTEPKIIDLAQASKIHVSLQAPQDELAHDKSQPPAFEITTFRSEGVYKDFRRPSSVVWGKTIQEDLKRRDFTINALALTVNPAKLKAILTAKDLPSTASLSSDDYQIIDDHQGMKDLSAQLIKTVGSPTERFQEDALRMLRAIRLAIQLKMNLDPATKAAIGENAALIQHISGERIRDEFLKMLKSDQAHLGIKLLDQTGLLGHIMPELLEGKGVDQAGHHTTDVWEHSLDALANCASADPIVRLATLLHDVAKPRTKKIIDGKITFYNHQIIGSRMASKIGSRLRLSNKQLQRLFTLVRYHMFHYQPDHSDASIRRFMRQVGLDNIDDILALREGDRLGSGARKTSWRLEEMKQRMIEQLNQPMDVTDLAVDGHDLMDELKLKPGRKLGELLNQLFELVIEDPELNQKEVLLAKAKKLLKE